MKIHAMIVWIIFILLSINISGCVEESDPPPAHIDESWLTINDKELSGGVLSISWSPDGTLLASTSSLANIKIFNTTTWQNTINVTGDDNPVGMISWDTDGGNLAAWCFDWSIRIWNTSTWVVDRILLENNTAFYPYAWNFNGTLLAAYIIGLREVRIWDTETWEIIEVIDDLDEVDYISWSPDGDEVAFAINRAVYIYDTMNWNYRKKINGFTASPNYISYSPDGIWFAAYVGDGTVQIWNTTNWKNLHSFSSYWGISGKVLAWSPNGDKLALWANHTKVDILNTTSWQMVQQLRGHESQIHDISWSPDGTKIATAEDVIKIWNVSQ